MQEYGADAIRNVALIGDGGRGKTSLAEALVPSPASARTVELEGGALRLDAAAKPVLQVVKTTADLFPCGGEDGGAGYASVERGQGEGGEAVAVVGDVGQALRAGGKLVPVTSARWRS